MFTIRHNSENLQERLDRLERLRREAALSGNLRQYALHLANENAVLRQMQSVAAEHLLELGDENESGSVYERARHLELDGS